jgi:hypothetical protein
VEQFTAIAKQADTSYGKVLSAKMLSTQMSGSSEAIITYTVVRAGAKNHQVTYPVAITLTLKQNTWTISDYANAFAPGSAPTSTPTTAPTTAPATGSTQLAPA